MQSGTLNAPWSYMTAERALQIARKLIDDVGCNGTQYLEDNPERVKIFFLFIYNLKTPDLLPQRIADLNIHFIFSVIQNVRFIDRYLL